MDSRAGRRGHFGPRKFFAGWLDELIAFAGHQFELNVRQEDGYCLRDHLEAAAGHSADAAAKLEGPPRPEALAYLWTWFLELCAGRGANGFGLSWTEVDAWCGVSRLQLSDFERGVLRALDAKYLQVFGQQKEEK